MSSNSASVRCRFWSITQRATCSPRRPGRVLPRMTAMRGVLPLSPCSRSDPPVKGARDRGPARQGRRWGSKWLWSSLFLGLGTPDVARDPGYGCRRSGDLFAGKQFLSDEVIGLPPLDGLAAGLELGGDLGKGLRRVGNGAGVDVVDASPAGVSLATLACPSSELVRLVTRPRIWRSSTSRVMRLADSPEALARSVIRSSRPGASDRHISVVYSFAVMPTVRTRSASRRRAGRARSA
jgi:hypothetical protein